MESMQDIRNRIQGINNTKQITESMRLAATSKVQKVRLRLEENLPFFEQSVKTAECIAIKFQASRNPYIIGRKPEKSLIIMITGDRGLCGGYNINVEKEATALANELGDIQIITIGTKGRDYCRRRQKPVVHSFHGLSENPFYEDAKQIGETALKMYDDKKIDQIYLVYTEYHSMLNQTPKSVRLLPLNATVSEQQKNLIHYENREEQFLQYAASLYICSVLFGAMLQSAVSEQCSRITSMDSAVKNSNKIIDSLTLMYNQKRQSAITQEIAEIVGGANAVEKHAD